MWIAGALTIYFSYSLFHIKGIFGVTIVFYFECTLSTYTEYRFGRPATPMGTIYMKHPLAQMFYNISVFLDCNLPMNHNVCLSVCLSVSLSVGLSVGLSVQKMSQLFKCHNCKCRLCLCRLTSS